MTKNNRKLLKKTFVVSIFVFIIISMGTFASSSNTENIFIFEGTIYRNHSIDLYNINLDEGTPTNFQDMGEYKITLTTEDKEDILFETYVPISWQAVKHGHGEEDDPFVEKEENYLYWRLPYKENAEYLNLYHEENLLIETDLIEHLCPTDGECTDYCDYHEAPVVDCTCGDGTCHEWENPENCPLDCPEIEEVDREEETYMSETIPTSAIITIIAAAIMITLYITLKQVEKR